MSSFMPEEAAPAVATLLPLARVGPKASEASEADERARARMRGKLLPPYSEGESMLMSLMTLLPWRAKLGGGGVRMEASLRCQ